MNRPLTFFAALLALSSAASSLEPLWVADAPLIAGPTASTATPLVGAIGALQNGDAIFFAESDKSHHSVVLLDGKTGKVKWRTSYPEVPEGMLEFNAVNKILPDERIVVGTVLWRFDPTDAETEPFKRRRLAQLHLRVFEPKTGKILAHKPMTFDDPATEKESGPVSWRGQFCFDLKRDGKTNLLLGQYFFAELSDDFSKLLRVTRFKERSFNRAFVAGGAVMDAGKDRKVWTVRAGEPEQLLAPPQQGWQLESILPLQTDNPSGIVVRALASDGKTQQLSLYDVKARKWAWSKTDADWAQAKPGPVTDLLWMRTFYLDARTGENRFQLPAKTTARILENGRLLLFRKPSEIAVVNCADGKDEALISRPEPFDLQRRTGTVEWFAGDRALVVDTKDGSVFVSLFRKSAGKLSPPSKLTLPPQNGPRMVLATHVGGDVYRLDIYSAKGPTYCAFSLPGA